MVLSEASLERRLVREIERRGGMARKFISPGWAGAQDRIVLMPGGRIWFIELKAPGKKLRPLQVKRAREVSALGFESLTISTVEELDAFLERVDEHGSKTL